MVLLLGNDAKSTICLDNENKNNGQIISIVTTSTSLLIESLIQQSCMLFEDDSERRNKLYLAICDRLHKLKIIDSSYNMIELEPLRGQYQQALYHLFTVARATIGCENALQIPRPLMTEWSRYHKEFQEISFIASGGFGNVFKALNRLDGVEYAIKKIIVRSNRIKNIMQHLEEVKTLAKLNHTNIVSYKGAWIEPPLASTAIPCLVSPNYSQNKLSSIEDKRKIGYKSCINRYFNSQSQQSSDTESQSPKESDEHYMSLQYNKQKNYECEKQVVIEENINKNIEKTNSNSISFRSDSEHQNNKIKNNISYSDGSNSNEEYSKNKILLPYMSQMNKKYTTLYIQMALCEKTLQQWLDERIETTPQTIIIAILTQIIYGLDYIHSRRIVHHDIKPSNIFISTSGQLQIQLGDFGLACPLQKENHHSILGTHMYAAPEQLQGKCDPKSDIYSLGIVLLELLVHTRTSMERIEIINNLKKGQIPTSLTATYPKWAYIVSQLVQEDPEKRPSTNQLLQDLNEDKDMMITCLKNDIIEKEDIIRKLQKKISILENQIVKHNILLQDI
ncbi:eukaryotic translation initiation factor 2-alpha kinase 1-like [Apis florea]|uniref:eukaryotic translation initiation factor 2-alpha kinase 1-like n=1 Tax=Apis florea TaxID=7463 RepID=UPI000252B536|nr:eukaryotic translation initiation factor 2-alpha kinase 1-like [Apis florea]